MAQYYNGNTGQWVNLQPGQQLPHGPGVWQPLGVGNPVQGGTHVPHPPSYTPPAPPAPSIFPSTPSSPSSSPFTSLAPAYTPPKLSSSPSYPSYGNSSYSGGAARPYVGGGYSGAAGASSLQSTPAVSQPSYSPRSGAASRAVSRFLRGVVALAIVLAAGIGALMYWRGYLSYSNSGFVLNGIPAVKTSDGLAYRKFDMDMEFRDRNIWTKPEEVKPNSYIEAGTIWTANLICPTGDFAVKGDLKNSRISVPNGTLTIYGDVSGSFIAARHIVTRGLVERTVESATKITNAGSPRTGNRVIKIAAGSPVIGFIPWPFAPRSAR